MLRKFDWAIHVPQIKKYSILFAEDSEKVSLKDETPSQSDKVRIQGVDAPEETFSTKKLR